MNKTDSAGSQPSSTPFRFRPSLLAAAVLCLGAAPALAQQPAQLEKVVVSASANARALADAPASVTVLSREQLAREPVASLQDALRRVEGVAVVGSDPNDLDITLRGMPGEYTLILVDGRRQNTRETMNRSTGGVQAFFMPPLAAIERIEIVRGPMSALYGADAMGGVVNIITRKRLDGWQGSASLAGSEQLGDRSLGDSRQADFWLGGPLMPGLLSLQLWGGAHEREEDRAYYANSATSGALGLRNHNLGARLGFTPLPDQQFGLELGSGRLKRGGRPGMTLPANAARMENEQQLDVVSLTHQGSVPLVEGARWRSALYREGGQQRNWSNGSASSIEPEVSNTVLDSILSLPLGAHQLHMGLQWQRNVIDGVALESAVVGHAASPSRIGTRSAALFAEDEIELSERLALTLGLRLDHEQRFGQHWSPRAYGIYKLDGGWSLRGGFGSGFKAPKLRQTEAAYCMSTGGPSPRRGSLCGNPDLKPETSRSAELGLRFDGKAGRYLAATLFHNRFRNKVVSFNTGAVDPRNAALDVYVYDNVDRVRISGLELAGQWPLSAALQLAGNYTYTDSQRQGGKETSFDGSSLDGRPLDKTPKHMASLRLDWQALAGLKTFLRANYEGEQYWAALRNGARGVRERGSVATLDLGASYALSKQLSLSATLSNLGNRQLAVDNRSRNAGLAENWQVDEGRRLWLKLGAEF
jgi:outer membrane receptor for ferrienterochelin and colicins